MTSLTPLSSVWSSWKGGLIPSAFAALQRGIQRERERFRGKPFVAVAQRCEIDYDGLWKYFDLIEGFADQPTAVNHVRRQAEAALSSAIAEPSYGTYRWQVVDPSVAPLFFQKGPNNPSINSVFCERFKVANGSGYDSKYFEFEVLHVTSAEIIGPELFSFVGGTFEWTSFLISRGENSGGKSG